MGVSISTQSTSCFIIISVWASSFCPLLGALDLRAGVEQPKDCLIIQRRQAVESRGCRWIRHLKTKWSRVWSSFPNSQAAEVAMSYPMCGKQEQKRLTPVGRRLSWTHAVLGRAIPGGWVGDESTEPRSAFQPFHFPFVIRPERCTSVTIVRWTDELLCSGYNWVSRFEMPCIPTQWTGEHWVEKMSRLHGTAY